jgi:hypothetical protein
MDSLDSKNRMINAAHILLVAPLLFYVGYYKGYGVPTWTYDLLVVLALIIVLYHGYRIYEKSATESFYYNY